MIVKVMVGFAALLATILVVAANKPKPFLIQRSTQLASQCSSTEAAVPSDHWPIGIRNRVSRSRVDLTPRPGSLARPRPKLQGL